MREHEYDGTRIEVSDEELHQLFAPRRVDDGSFGAGVAARIRALEEAPSELHAESTGLRDRLGRAAAVAAMDPGVLATGGATAAKAAGAKWLPGVLAFPALLLGSFVGAFALSSHALKGAFDEVPMDETDQERRERKRQLREANKRVRFILSVMTTPAMFLMVSHPALGSDLFIGYMALTMVSLVYLTRQLAARRSVLRQDVRATVEAAFGTTFFVLLGGAFNLGSVPSSDIGFGPSMAAMLIGLGIVSWRTVSHRRKLFYLVVAVGVVNVLGFTFASGESLRRQVDRMEVEATEPEEWLRAAAVARALDAVGEARPAASALRGSFQAMLADPGSIPTATWASAADLGLLTDADWSLAAGWKSDSLSSTGIAGAIDDPEGAFAVRAAWRSRSLDGSVLERLIEARERCWPAVGDPGGLVKAVRVMHTFDRLGQSDFVDAQSERVHELLLRHFVTPARASFPVGSSGGFTSAPGRTRSCTAVDTFAAVELMHRFGVPEGIDIRRVQAYLRREARNSFLFFEPYASRPMEARAGLLVLREGIGIPRRTLVAAVLGERFFFATLMLVLLGLLAVHWAPHWAPHSRLVHRGAQP